MRVCGQTFTASIRERIRGAVAAESGLARSALSRRVCEWLGWRDAKGKPKEVSSRKALVELERRGAIALPEARCALPPQPFAAPAFAGSLEGLGALAFSAAAWQLAVRDGWIGWRPHARRANLQQFVGSRQPSRRVYPVPALRAGTRSWPSGDRYPPLGHWGLAWRWEAVEAVDIRVKRRFES